VSPFNGWGFKRIDWVGEMHSRGLLDGEGAWALSNAFRGGAYVAGGFARALAHGVLCGGNNKDAWNRIDWYSQIPAYAKKYGAPWNSQEGQGDAVYWKANAGDIDLFFRDPQGVAAMISALECRPGIYGMGSSRAGYAMDYRAGSRALQIITKVHGDPEDVIGTFDIANAKVVLDGEGIHYTMGWLQLEEKKQLGIDNWNKPNLLWRVRKWVKKHYYDDLRPGDHAPYVEAVFSAMEAVNAGTLVRWGEAVKKHNIHSFAKMFVRTSPPAEVLKISMLLDSYDQMNVLRELTRKGMKNDQQ
jgi:hypothetical protein